MLSLRSLSRVASTQKWSSLAVRSATTWSQVKMGPPDAILGVTEAFKKDQSGHKMNLGVGAYRDDSGKPYVLNCVRKAEKSVAGKALDKEYLPITGLSSFTEGAAKLAWGDNVEALTSGRVVTCQSISGTGALRIAGAFFSRWYPHAKTIYLPTPSWGNHTPIFRDSGLEVKGYRYFDKSTNGLDEAGMLEDLKNAPENSIILLHACAHNPTGVDPTKQQWQKILDTVISKNHFPLFDMAYQGFASGDITKDAHALRLFLSNPKIGKEGKLMMCQSFAKNLGLYGERVGSIGIVCKDTEEKSRVESQVKILVRAMYSNPPLNGARIVSEVLHNNELKEEWLEELSGMANRIITMRKMLKHHLVDDFKSQINWDHITNQIGMFCYSGLTPEEVDALKSKHSVYLTRDGRISIAGISSHNVKYLAQAIHEVTKHRA
ncbi:aspartate aminotransferase [Paraphysoderma sedebokerense]|nr:aspartate aminotransferase [Paraphysoderma sedebokerense]